MPRIVVVTEDPAGEAAHSEHVTAEDFVTEHFRRALCQRIAWAVEDATAAEAAQRGAAEPAAPRHARPRATRGLELVGA